jgi:shikimate dehydrogenase
LPIQKKPAKFAGFFCFISLINYMDGTYGLLGKKLKHSFSKLYFESKFEALKISAQYNLFELENIQDIKNIFSLYSDLKGLNVTLPYKTSIIPFLDELDPLAEACGAVNCVVVKDGKTIGYNTDIYGFHLSLQRFLPKDFKKSKALILGTGGASRAVALVVSEFFNASFLKVSRTPQSVENIISYSDLFTLDLNKYPLIINTTPVGMFPLIDDKPNFPYEKLSEKFWVFDLIYNPEKTLFLSAAEKQQAHIKNGLEMLYLQAEKAWEIWQA